MICRRCEGGADGRRIAHLHPIETLFEPVAVERRRTEQRRIRREENHTHAVVWPRSHEFARKINYRLNPAGRLPANCEVLRQHSWSRIQHEHDVHPAVFRAANSMDDLRARERDGHQHECQQRKPDAGQPWTFLRPLAHCLQRSRGGKYERRRAARAALQDGDSRRNHQQRKHSRPCKPKTFKSGKRHRHIYSPTVRRAPIGSA